MPSKKKPTIKKQMQARSKKVLAGGKPVLTKKERDARRASRERSRKAQMARDEKKIAGKAKKIVSGRG